MSEKPNAGTKCFPCYINGHYCPATTYTFEVPVCQACAANRLCEPQIAKERLLQGSSSIEDQWRLEGWAMRAERRSA